jgi:hypothetical protein
MQWRFQGHLAAAQAVPRPDSDHKSDARGSESIHLAKFKLKFEIVLLLAVTASAKPDGFGLTRTD